MNVRRDGPASIARQMADQLAALIQAGALAPGERLPPVRMFAGFLRVNRNTVARVYRDLEREGWLVSSRGRGTFVAAAPPVRAVPPIRAASPTGITPATGPAPFAGVAPAIASAPVHGAAPSAGAAAVAGITPSTGTALATDDGAMAAYADHLLAEARARGWGLGELYRLLDARARGRWTEGPLPRLGFVECNASDLAYFTRQLSARLGVPLTPVLLADLPGAADGLDIVATTLFHAEEVRARLPGREVVGLMAAPDFRTLDEVAHLPARTRIALVCATQEGVESKERSIRAVGIARDRIRTATLSRPDRLREALRGADVVLASPKVLERIAGLIPARVRAIAFASVLGDGALRLLEQRIRTWRPDRARKGARRR